MPIRPPVEARFKRLRVGANYVIRRSPKVDGREELPPLLTGKNPDIRPSMERFYAIGGFLPELACAGRRGAATGAHSWERGVGAPQFEPRGESVLDTQPRRIFYFPCAFSRPLLIFSHFVAYCFFAHVVLISRFYFSTHSYCFRIWRMWIISYFAERRAIRSPFPHLALSRRLRLYFLAPLQTPILFLRRSRLLLFPANPTIAARKDGAPRRSLGLAFSIGAAGARRDRFSLGALFQWGIFLFSERCADSAVYTNIKFCWRLGAFFFARRLAKTSARAANSPFRPPLFRIPS